MVEAEISLAREQLINIDGTDYEVIRVKDDSVDLKRMWDGERLTRDKAFVN